MLSSLFSSLQVHDNTSSDHVLTKGEAVPMLNTNIFIILLQIFPHRRKVQVLVQLQLEDGRSGAAWRVFVTQTYALPRADRKVYASRRDCPETQHFCEKVVHSRTQRQDIPLPSRQRLRARRRKERRTSLTTVKDVEPLLRQTKGDVKKIFALHCTASRFRIATDATCGGQSQLNIAAGYIPNRMCKQVSLLR